MNHNSIGTFSNSAQIWDPKNVYMNKILQKNWSCTIKHRYLFLIFTAVSTVFYFTIPVLL